MSEDTDLENGAADHEDLLETAVDLSNPPPLIPTGTWLLKATGLSYKVNPDNDGKDKAMIILTPVKAGSDVDAEEAANEDAWRGGKLFKRYTVEGRRDMFNFLSDVAKFGIEVSGVAPKKVFEVFNKVKPKVMGEITVRSYKDKAGNQRTDNDIKNLAPVGEDADAA